MAARPPQRIVGIDLGSDTLACAVYTPARTLVGEPFEVPNRAAGFATLHSKLTAPGLGPAAVLVGFEAIGRYWEPLYQFLADRGYQIQLLHPVQRAQFAREHGLQDKTDCLDGTMIANLLFSGEVGPP